MEKIGGLRRLTGAVGPTASARRRVLWRMLLPVALACLLLAGAWMERRVEADLHHIVSQQLAAILQTDIAALQFWLDQASATVRAWADDEQLQALVDSLHRQATGSEPSAPALSAAPEQAQLRELLDPLLDTDDYLGYAVVDPAGLILATSTKRSIGERVTAEGQAIVAKILERPSAWLPPAWRGQYLASEPLQADATLMGVAARIPGDGDRPRAALLLFIPPEKDFSRLLALARMGDSGDTYAFDDQGRMLSDTRHLDALKAAGILPEDESVRAVLRIELRDPGGNLLRGHRSQDPPAGRPLTRLVAAALSDTADHHVIVEPYRDYRGVAVVGAARWLPAFGFGVATEVDAAEAFRALRPLEIAFWALAGLLLAALAGLAASALAVRRMGRHLEKIRQLGQYTLEEKIGEGGMGKVYLARHALLRRPTAVKLISAAAANAETLARFEHEVQLTSQLTHPNTIEVYDYGQTPEGVFYYVMEYLPGIDLARLLELEGRIPPNRAAHILCQVCGSLAEAHARGFIHRDIKPMNIILTERGGVLDFVKVLDFGLVKELGATSHTSAEAIPGTPPYIAPERLGDPRNVDARTDIYSVGAVAFNLLTGQAVFEGNSALDIAYKAMTAQAPRVGEFVDIDPQLERLVGDCLARDPAARPPSAQVVCERLQAAIPTPWTQAQARDWWAQHPELLKRADAGT